MKLVLLAMLLAAAICIILLAGCTAVQVAKEKEELSVNERWEDVELGQCGLDGVNILLPCMKATEKATKETYYLIQSHDKSRLMAVIKELPNGDQIMIWREGAL